MKVDTILKTVATGDAIVDEKELKKKDPDIEKARAILNNDDPLSNPDDTEDSEEDSA
jgi:hypothetical protein